MDSKSDNSSKFSDPGLKGGGAFGRGIAMLSLVGAEVNCCFCAGVAAAEPESENFSEQRIGGGRGTTPTLPHNQDLSGSGSEVCRVVWCQKSRASVRFSIKWVVVEIRRKWVLMGCVVAYVEGSEGEGGIGSG